MKKKYLLIGSLAFSYFLVHGQVPQDTIHEKINKTEIELVYNHYIQDGNNSAVTGGIGTEKLIVYGPSIYIKKAVKNNSIAFNVGADIVTSASTDQIDFVMSSASKTDTRSFGNTTIEHKIEKQNIDINAGLGFSIESDYFSIGSKLGLVKSDKSKLRNFSVELAFFNDDLRWGRENHHYYRPVKLIYPVELRYKEWYDEYKRNSYNLKLGFKQVLNQRNILGIFPEITYQEGLLATPFHRIYFSDGSEAVEQLPDKRWKEALALKLNSFIGGRIILKNTINSYSDNFGIFAFSIENETAIKLRYDLTLLPNIRFYSQNASPYFAPYGMHKTNETFYTSDFDLSKMQTYNAGIGFKFNPYKYLSKRLIFNVVIIRYNFMYRSNNLSAHIFSIALQTEYHKRTH